MNSNSPPITQLDEALCSTSFGTGPLAKALGINSFDVITINGVDYAPIKPRSGSRAVIVIDRGWIFAGDVTRSDGRIKLSRCVWVFKWDSCGFAAVIDDPSKADIRPHADIDIPKGAEIFSVPVDDNWGLGV